MVRLHYHALALAIGCLLALPAAGQPESESRVRVEFLQPESYRDAFLDFSAPRRGRENPVLQELAQHLQAQGAKYLGEDQSLLIQVRDIDLAGGREPAVDPQWRNIRLLNSHYPPRLKFSYSWRAADGSLIQADTVDLRDLGFTTQSQIHASDRLRYEKRMLSRWMQRSLRAGQ